MGKLRDLLKLEGKPRCTAKCPKCRRRCIYDQGHSLPRHVCSKDGHF